MSEKIETEYAIGAHSVRLEEPDILIFRHVGDLSQDEVVRFVDHVDQFSQGKPGIFVVIDQTHSGAISSDARRVLLPRMSNAVLGMAFVSTSLVARVGISLGYKAYLMMNRGQEHPHTFAESEAQARDWIVEQRKRRVQPRDAGSR